MNLLSHERKCSTIEDNVEYVENCQVGKNNLTFTNDPFQSVEDPLNRVVMARFYHITNEKHGRVVLLFGSKASVDMRMSPIQYKKVWY